ncbi:DUF58 domain-containing protein [Endozoicomonas ascidiicola]|uniref:DUF58 domain-containing protein n=2 Tax=Endozoicomonas ascidiicola TaxID=1698521 RepID=UPI000830A6BF|nr:DUF58 domain-containing protein [Endozoicomonas ascidiicola]
MRSHSMNESLKSPEKWLSERFRRWIDSRSPRSHRIRLNQRRIYIVPTGYGFFWLLMVLLVFLVATNYSNSLAFGLCFFMLSLFQISMIHTWRNLAGITLVVRGAESVYAGEPVPVNLECLTEGRQRFSILMGWPESEMVSASFSHEHEQSLLAPEEQRGRFRPGRMLIKSIYPLGFFRTWTWVRLDCHSLIYPAPEEGIPLPEGNCGKGGERSLVKSGIDDFHGFRGYQETDSPSHVYWQGFAKTGELLTKQFDQPVGRELWFSLDQVAGYDLEKQLSILTGWCLYCERQRFSYGLTLGTQKLSPANGAVHLHKAFELLALYNVDDSDER